ncbi:MAG: VC0807 family protein [Janthinobacterium lividum]
MADRSTLLTMARERGPGLLGEVVVNFVLPYVIYSWSSDRLGEVGALLASSVPPIAWSLVELVRHRRVDALSIVVLGGIALSILAFFGGGSARMLQLREKMVTGIIGIAFLGSALIGRPLIYELARAGMRRRASPELEQFERLRDQKPFRRTMTIMTVVWGVGLLADVAIGATLVFTLSIREYLIVGPIVGYGVLGTLSAWTFWYSRRQKARGDARRAAESRQVAPT